MAGHDQETARRATQPSERDVAIAESVVLGRLASGAVLHAQNMIEEVRHRFADEPLPALFGELDDVTETDCRAAWSTAAAMTALANLQWTGQIIPCDVLDVPDIGALTLVWRSPHGAGPVRDMRPEYSFPIGRQLRLSPWLRAPAPDSLAALRWPVSGAGDKVTRVLREAAESYRRGLDVAATILIGVASEAAWVELAEAVGGRSADEALRSLVEGERARAAALAERTADILQGQFNARPHEIRRLLTEAAHLRDLRDYAVHEPASRFDEQLFTRAGTGVLLESAADYFRRLYAVVESVRDASRP
jgi:hypothetical protein